MDQLREISGVRQTPEEPHRRWFTCDDMDLMVWESVDGEVVGFQLYYDKQYRERVVLWRACGDLSHMGVDDGEARPLGHKAAPILVPDDTLDVSGVLERFLSRARNLPGSVVQPVRQHLREQVR